MVERIPITAAGLEKLNEELRQLQNVVRPDVERRLGEAREHGDLSENSEFDAAREELWRVDQSIAELQDRITRAEIVSSAKVNKEEVAFGAFVRLKDLKHGDIDEYTFVGEGESNPAQGRIAITTPIGQALLGHKAGETVEIQIPAGLIRYQILEIRYE